MRVAVIGAGWAGCAAAVEAARLGHAVTLFEAGRIAGGRARRVDSLDNGQHILIGAYAATLQLMRDVGIDTEAALLRLPLTLQYPNGDGLELPLGWPSPLDALIGILRASGRGWAWRDKVSLLLTAGQWQLQNFVCAPTATVADLCQGLRPGPMQHLIAPLCISALNTPAHKASGTVFLRVLRDSLFAGKGVKGASNLLLPKLDLSALLPDAAIAWLLARGHTVRLGERVQTLELELAGFDQIILACPALEAARLAATLALETTAWQQQARSLRYEAITTVYLQAAPSFGLPQPMLALHSAADAPAQFVFDRGALGGPPGLLAFVVSASLPDVSAVEVGQQVLSQARQQLANIELQQPLRLVQTIVEKRATFACTPNLQRPAMQLAPGLLACGDYIDGPYPATLEGAVLSGLAAARALVPSQPMSTAPQKRTATGQ